MINVAIIGAGFMGKVHANAYENIENAKLVAVYDRNISAAADFAKEFECEKYSDFDMMMKDMDIDVVDICLPTFLHEEYTILSAKYKKNIFCEKPITLNMESLDKMIEAIEKNNVKIFVGHVLRFWPEYVKAKELYDNGDLGDIKYIYAARLSEHPEWSEWYRQPENSGGGLLDLHLHDIDFMCWLFGDVESVYATGMQNELGSWNYVSSILNFRSGHSATVQGVIEMENGYPFTMDLKLVGSKITYEYVMKAGKNLENIEESLRKSYIYDDGAVNEIKVNNVDAYEQELKHFINCVEADKNSEVIDIYMVKKVLATIEALKASLENKKIVEVEYEKGI